jgi:hypothetical protein
VAHLAGALGVPVWMALSTTPDWRWLSATAARPSSARSTNCWARGIVEEKSYEGTGATSDGAFEFVGCSADAGFVFNCKETACRDDRYSDVHK